MLGLIGWSCSPSYANNDLVLSVSKDATYETAGRARRQNTPALAATAVSGCAAHTLVLRLAQDEAMGGAAELSAAFPYPFGRARNAMNAAIASFERIACANACNSASI